MATESRPARPLDELLAESPQSRGVSIGTLWREGGSISGPLSGVLDAEPRVRLDLLATLRVIAMSETRQPDVIGEVLENANPSPVSDKAAVHSAASFVVARPEIMRFISANRASIAKSSNWTAAMPGLGVAVTSVPLAEEALGHLVAEKAELPAELTRFVLLNPWFSRSFAARYRRYGRAKRIRFQDRAATARAWSHARALLRDKVPAAWHSPHGRGSGRAIDPWSFRFLGRYTDLVQKVYHPEGIPPAMAALFAIACGADVSNRPGRDTLAGWHVLPEPIERAALNLIGIGPSPGSGLEPAPPKDTGIFKLKASRGMVPRISWR